LLFKLGKEKRLKKNKISYQHIIYTFISVEQINYNHRFQMQSIALRCTPLKISQKYVNSVLRDFFLQVENFSVFLDVR